MTKLEEQLETLIGTGQVARELGVSTAYVLDLVALGSLKLAGRTAAGWRLFDREEVQRFKRERASR